MNTMHLLAAVLAAAQISSVQPLGGGGLSKTSPTRRERPPNLLVVVLDDVGVEWLAAYDLGPSPAPTPTLEALRQRRGVLFERAYADPLCSPTRAELLTGLRAHRAENGIGDLVTATGVGLPPDTTPTVARDLQGAGYATAMLGKAHLTSDADGLDALNRLGFDHFAGTLRNLRGSGSPQDDHYTWNEVVDGVQTHVSAYTSTRITDRALAWIAAQGSRPWFAHVGYHAPHVPRQEPPPHLHSQVLPRFEPMPGEDPRPWHVAMIEAVDTELGRLLAAVDLATTVVVILGDNGSVDDVLDPPFAPGTGKGTVGEGGVRVPLLVVAPDAPPGSTTTAVTARVPDVTATLRDYAGLPPQPGGDGRSLRPWVRAPATQDDGADVLVQLFSPNRVLPIASSRRAVIRSHAGRRWKYARRDDGTLPAEELWDLDADPFGEFALDLGNLQGPAASAYALLQSHMDAVEQEL